ncbi:MAG: DUF5074 domain-containing protein [Rikenellaceae bacterium]|nr:DUF5074 domain-containing protein [Rikenellaceae bacterium]
MKKLFTLLFAAAMLSGCYDDADLWDRVDDLVSRIKALEEQIATMNSEIKAIGDVVGILEEGKSIVEVEQIAEGIRITLDDGTHFVIENGSDGQNGISAPVIGVREHTDGIYYWTITTDGVEKWLPDSDIPVLRVTGRDGYTPTLGVDDEGYWTVDGDRIADGNGGFVKAFGQDGTDGTSLIADIDLSDEDCIVFVLANGTVLTLPVSNAYLRFDTTQPVTFIYYNSTRLIDLAMKNIEYAEILSAPEGWTAAISQADGYITVTAAPMGGKEEGVVTLVALDHNGNTLMAAHRVSIPDYTDPAGTFLLNEGNSYSQDGAIVWYDGHLNEYRDVYRNSNEGRSPGSILQDMFIADGKAYLVCQNGSDLGGDGQLLICDAKTMALIKAYNGLDFGGTVGTDGRPQHIVVANGKAFIQYADNMMEYNSAIRVFDLENGIPAQNDIDGTYGEFGTTGALKARMLYSRGKIIAPLAKGFVIIDSATEKVTKTVTFTGGVKDIVKGADGNLYIAVTGDYTIPGGYDGPYPAGCKIYCYSHNGEKIDEYDLPGTVTFSTSTAYPNIGMSASFNYPYLYFSPSTFSWTTYTGQDYISKFDYSTRKLDLEYATPQRYSVVYGYTGEHPFEDVLFVPGNPNYMASRLTVYDISDPDHPGVLKDYRYTDYTASPAGIYFAQSFSDGFIEK